MLTEFWNYAIEQQAPVSKPEGRTSCTLIPGDGVGPELLYSVQEVFKVTAMSFFNINL